MRVIEKIEVSKLKYGCVVVTQNFLFNYSLFKIILNPSKKVEFSSENQKDMSVDGTSFPHCINVAFLTGCPLAQEVPPPTR